MAGARAVPLCRLADLADGESKGFDRGPGASPRDIFLVREGAAVRGYVNACPHLGVPLEFQPDRFLTADGAYILCATHGALFRIEDGHCFAGPCAGLGLEPLALTVDAEGQVLLYEGERSSR